MALLVVLLAGPAYLQSLLLERLPMLCSQALAEELHTVSRWEYDQGDRYSLEFLKRKLPEHTVIMYNRERDDWEAWLQTRLPTKPEVLKVYFHHVCGDTPANAAAALAIKGYKLGMVRNTY